MNCSSSRSARSRPPVINLVLLFRSETVTLLDNRESKTATYGPGCNLGPPYMVCFFDALRDTVKKDAKTPKGPPGEIIGSDAPFNPVKKQAVTRK
jgi:hypothetical protein